MPEGGTSILYTKSPRMRHTPLANGGGVAHAHLPCFASSGNGSIEVHFLDVSGAFLKKATYSLTSTVVGALALGGTTGGAGTFLGDCPENAVGFMAFARTAPVQIGRGGLRDIENKQVANWVNPAAPTPETLYVGDALCWCLVAGSNGWQIIREPGSGFYTYYGKTVLFANFTTSSSGDTTVVAASAGNKIKVIGYGANANGTTNVKFTDGAGGATLGMLMYLAVNVGSNDRGSILSPLWEGSVNTALVVNNSLAIAISGHVAYLLEP